MNSSIRPLGIREIAAELGCCKRTIRRLHKQGKLPTFKVGEATSPIKMAAVDMRRLTRKRK